MLGGRTLHKGSVVKALTVVSALYGLYILLYTAGILSRLNLHVYQQSHHVMVMGIGIALAFVYFPLTKRSPNDKVPWYDIIAIVLTLVVHIYLALNAVAILREGAPPNTMQQAFGLIAVAVVIECVRRTAGPILALLGLVFFIYPFIVQYLPPLFYGPKLSLAAIIGNIYLYPSGIYGPISHLFATIIAAFIMFGAFLTTSGVGDFFTKLALALAGHMRGGPAKVAVLSSAFFGSTSGSGMANAAVTGSITIPLMKRLGYRPQFAAAVEAVASNGGCLMPPVLGAIAFVMMDFLGVSYLTIMLASILPAIIYFSSVLLMVDIEARKNDLRGLPRHELPSLRQTLREGWLYLVPLIGLVFLLVVARYSPETSAIYSLGLLLLLGLFKREMRMGPKKVMTALSGGSQSLVGLIGAIGVCGLLLGSISLTGVGFTLSGKLVTIAAGNVIYLLLLTAGACLMLGTSITTIGVYMITAVLLAPALVAVGIPPLAAHFFVWFMGLAAMITPPVCLLAYLTATIAGSGLMRTGFESTRLGIATYLVPFAIAFSPALILIGSVGDIATSAICALLGVAFMSYGLQGFGLKRLNWPLRIMLFAGGGGLFAPFWTIRIAGLSLATLVTIWHLARTRLARKATNGKEE